MDERALASAQDYESRYVAEAKARGEVAAKYTIVVLGHENNEPFSIMATSREDLMNQLSARGHNVSADWGAGRLFGGDAVSGFGPSDEAQALVENHLLKR